MNKNTKFPKSLRRHIRLEKGRIRKENISPKDIKGKIEEIYKKIRGKKES